jgi:hypothetical protein
MNTTRKGLNMFKSLNADLIETIITEIKEMRKGVVMIVFICCILCALLDIAMRKHGTKLDWFTQIYLITGFFSFSAICIKIYNSYCDKQDAIKAEKQKAIQEHEKILNNLKLLKPIFDNMLFNQQAILYQFVQENSNIIIVPNNWDLFEHMEYIKSLLHIVNYEIKEKTTRGYTKIEISTQFLELLKLYFSGKPKK